MVNANPLLPVQWAAVAMVFTGLIASSVMKGSKHGKKAGKHRPGAAGPAALANGNGVHDDANGKEKHA